jgi:phosphoglucomutase
VVSHAEGADHPIKPFNIPRGCVKLLVIFRAVIPGESLYRKAFRRIHYMATIKFGTSGWRAIIADEFTYENMRLVAASIAQLAKTLSPNPRLIVGYDTRFQAEHFAWECAEVLSSLGVHVDYCQTPTPTPAIAYEILRRQASGGVNFTASHNPGEYLGIKFSTPDGAPALPEVTRQLEATIEALRPQKEKYNSWQPDLSLIEKVDLADEYLAMLASKVDLKLIARSGLSFCYDPLWGTGRGYLNRLLTEAGISSHTLHDFRDVTFGGRSPEPAEDHLEELKQKVAETGSSLGLSTDGDADRFGILDGDGAFIPPNQIIPLLLDYLIESRGWQGGAARSVATSHFLDAVTRHHGRQLHETPVGFKYIGELIKSDLIVIGGEESAGLTIKGHVPEKDGILACLLTAEMVASRKKSLKQQLSELQQKVGRFETLRLNLRLTPELKEIVKNKMENPPTSLGGKKIASLNRLDGLKIILEDGTWILLRLSGTEPVARCYVEAHDPAGLAELEKNAREFVLGVQ